MTAGKTLREREEELRALIRTPAGRAELEALADRYAAEGGGFRQSRSSVITYVLVCERVRGAIRL